MKTMTLNIIGAGSVGKTLARLWYANQTYAIQDVMNRSVDSAQRATIFIGSGRAVDRFDDLRPADICMIATPDDQIAECCRHLSDSGLLSAQSIVFHCSGALTSDVLQAAHACGAAVASIHPIRSFAAPERVANEFAGTFCGTEGDSRALDVLGAGFKAIGAQLVPILPELKIVYHAASVFACNYLTTLLDVARQSYVKAGVPSDTALKMMAPLVRETVDNIFRVGPAQALTGPIARGDVETVARQRDAVLAFDERYGRVYADFVELTTDLAKLKQKTKT